MVGVLLQKSRVLSQKQGLVIYGPVANYNWRGR